MLPSHRPNRQQPPTLTLSQHVRLLKSSKEGRNDPLSGGCQGQGTPASGRVLLQAGLPRKVCPYPPGTCGKRELIGPHDPAPHHQRFWGWDLAFRHPYTEVIAMSTQTPETPDSTRSSPSSAHQLLPHR